MERVLQVLGSLQRGGAETLVMNIYRNIDRNKIQFDFIVRENVKDGYEDEVKKLGGRIFVIPSPQKIGLIKCIGLHKKVIKENGPYISIHAHMNAMSFVSMIAAKKCGIKNRISHSHNTSFPGKLKSFFGSRLTRIYSTKLLACSEESGKKLFGNSNFEVIQNGIIIEKFLVHDLKEKVKIQNKLKMDNKCLNICHVGRYVEQKNHEFIVELAAQLKRMKIKYNIYLLGDGPKYDSIKSIINANGLSDIIHMVGSVSNANEYFMASDIMILPSYFEGFPVTLVESQASGLPALVSNTITPKVDFGLGLIKFMQLDINDWANYIIKKNYDRLYDTNRIYDTISKNNYNIRDTSNKIIKLYLE